MYIYVKVIAGSKREEVIVLAENRLMISVKEQASRGEANRKVIELVALYFRRPRESVRLVHGHTMSKKLLSIED